MNTPFRVRAAQPGDAAGWLALRIALWPGDAASHEADVRDYFEQPRGAVAFLAFADDDAPIGMAEATLRTDHVNGADTSPVGFLEGLYVVPAWRRRAVGRALVAAVEDWTRMQGCVELASDALLANVDGQRAHLAFGFEEAGRVVYYRRRLLP